MNYLQMQEEEEAAWFADQDRYDGFDRGDLDNNYDEERQAMNEYEEEQQTN